MTMPRKNRRNIVVDGVKYHWSMRTSREWWQFLYIQQAAGRGSLLRFDCCDIPSLPQIAEGILFALQHGWDPGRGKPFYLGFENRSHGASFVVREANASEYRQEFIVTDPKQWRTGHHAAGPMLRSLPTELLPGRSQFEVQEYLGVPDKTEPRRDMYRIFFNMPRCIELIIHYDASDQVVSYRVSWVKTEDFGKFLESPDDIPWVPR